MKYRNFGQAGPIISIDAATLRLMVMVCRDPEVVTASRKSVLAGGELDRELGLKLLRDANRNMTGGKFYIEKGEKMERIVFVETIRQDTDDWAV